MGYLVSHLLFWGEAHEIIERLSMEHANAFLSKNLRWARSTPFASSMFFFNIFIFLVFLDNLFTNLRLYHKFDKTEEYERIWEKIKYEIVCAPRSNW